MYSIIKSMSLALLLTLTYTIQTNAQSVSGTIYDAKTGDPLAGANVVQVGTQNGVSAGADGQFSITLRNSGSREIRISYVGYTSQMISLSIQPHRWK